MSKKKSGRRVWRGVTTATASLLALSVCASTVVDGFRTDIDKFLGTKSTKLVTENSDGTDLYTFKSDYTSTTELLHGIQDVGERMSEEGSVLLKNNGALPLTQDETQKITLLGFSSYYPVQGGDMGSSLVENTGTDADTVDMVQAFKAKGFSMNQTVADMYEALQPTFKSEVQSWGGTIEYNHITAPSTTGVFSSKEPSQAALDGQNATWKDSLNDNNVMIVTIARSASENGTYQPGTAGVDPTQNLNQTDPLGLSDDERDLINAAVTAKAANGGKVIVQVEKIVQGGSLDPKLVAIPGIYVDSVVVGTEEENMQCLGMPYDGALTGEFRIPVDAIPPIPMDAKKIIARRAAMELPKDAIVNLGTGAPEKIANVAAEEGISDNMTLTVEAGSIAGVPYGGTQFGAAANAMCIIPHNVQFDFYQGGGLDVAFLGLAETAPNGDLNVSKFGTRLAGAGGFIDITQNAKKVVYCGTFTAKGLKTECKDGKLVITQEGAKKKFVKQVEHITFSGDYANEVHQPVLYITERCVFELRPEGVTLTEIAPGIDLQTQILDQMEFVPKMADEIKTMDARIFRDELMGLAND